MEENLNVVDVTSLIKDVKFHVYFGFDIASKEMTMFFNSSNVETAVRSFCLTLNTLPDSMVKDFILVDGDTREIVFEGKDYLDKWEAYQARKSQWEKGLRNA